MNTHDIELPAEFRSGNSVPVAQATIKRERMEEILCAAIEADRKRRGEPVPDWENRDMKSHSGWINELGTLSQHPEAMPGWVRAAVKTIYVGLIESAPQPAEPVHADDAVVDAFATAMKAKLAKKRAEGRGGWQMCSARYLSRLLREHVEKGDPVDVANLAMMLHQNGQRIEPVKVPSDATESIKQLEALMHRVSKAAIVVGYGGTVNGASAESNLENAEKRLMEHARALLARYGKEAR